jgi:hypothetical protein
MDGSSDEDSDKSTNQGSWIDDTVKKVFVNIQPSDSAPSQSKDSGVSGDSNDSAIVASNPMYVDQYVAFLRHILDRAKNENNYDLLDAITALLGAPSPSEEPSAPPAPRDVLDAISELLGAPSVSDKPSAPPAPRDVLDAISELLGAPSAPPATDDVLNPVGSESGVLGQAAQLLGTSDGAASKDGDGATVAVSKDGLSPDGETGQGPDGETGQGPDGETGQGPEGTDKQPPEPSACGDSNVCIENIDIVSDDSKGSKGSEQVTDTTIYNIVGDGKKAEIHENRIPPKKAT